MHHAMHFVTRLADAVALQEGELRLGEALLPHDSRRRFARPVGAQSAQEGDGVAQEAGPRVVWRQRRLRRTRQAAV